MKLRTREWVAGYSFLGPAILLVVGLILYPLVYNVWLSFTRVPLDPGESYIFVGLRNYVFLLGSSGFRRALLSSFVFTVATVFGSIILGLAVALVMNREFKGVHVVRVISLLPYATPIIASALVWKYMLHPTFGILNFIFVDIVPIFSQPIAWTSAPHYALLTVIIFGIWRYFPFAYIVILAGLQRIPKTYYDAAKVDGASVWRRFTNITLPELGYILSVLFFLRWIWNFNNFADVYLLSSTVKVVPVFLFERGFQAFDLGTAAATAVFLLLLQLVFAVPFFRGVLRI